MESVRLGRALLKVSANGFSEGNGADEAVRVGTK
jgi:hypothetical protein